MLPGPEIEEEASVPSSDTWRIVDLDGRNRSNSQRRDGHLDLDPATR